MRKRSQLRDHKPKAHGPVKPLHKRKAKKDKMNEGGFYEGMPGCTLDEYGNRKMIDFVVMPSGYNTCRIYAHPQFLKIAIEKACQNNNEIKGIVQGAAIDMVFKDKGLLNMLIRYGLKLRRKKAYKDLIKKEALQSKEDGKA